MSASQIKSEKVHPTLLRKSSVAFTLPLTLISRESLAFIVLGITKKLIDCHPKKIFFSIVLRICGIHYQMKSLQYFQSILFKPLSNAG